MKKNFIYNLLLTSSNLLFPLLTFPYLSRILGAEGLGICNFIMSYGQNYTIIAALGMPVYATREIAKIGDDINKRSKLFFELLSVQFLFTVLLLIIYTISIFTLKDFKDYKELGLLGGSMIILNVFSIEWLFVGINNFKYITFRSLIVRVLSILAIFLLVRSKNDFSIYFIILVATVFFTALIDVYSAKNFITRRITLTTRGILKHLKPLVVLGIYMILTSIYSILPTTLLGFLSTKSAVGYYYGANRIIRMIISVFTALITVMVPKLNLVFEKKSKEDYLLLIYKSLNVVICFGIPITFFVYLMANPIVMLLAGKNFINSIYIIQVMAPIILIVAFAQVFVLLILSVNRKDNHMVFLSVVGMVISLLINLFFIPNYAEKATAFSQLLAELTVTTLSFYLSKKILNFSFPTKSFLINLALVIPFSIFSYISFQVFYNEFLIIILCGILCGLYFLFYQLYILKNKLLLEIITPYFQKIKSRVHYFIQNDNTA